MKRIILSFIWCACTLGMQEQLTPSIQQALLAIKHEQNHKAWRYFREEQVPVNKHCDGMPFFRGDARSAIKLFEIMYTGYTGIARPKHRLCTSYYTFHDRFLIKRTHYADTCKTYILNKEHSFEACVMEDNPGKSQVREKYWIHAYQAVGIVKYRGTNEHKCIIQPRCSTIHLNTRTYKGTKYLQCVSSFDEENDLLVTYQQTDQVLHNVVICKFLQGKGDLVAVLKKDVGATIADVIIRNNVVMIVTKEGHVTQFYPYDPTYFELQPQKRVRGCDAYFIYENF